MSDLAIGVRIDPYDNLFFRDGRPMEAANHIVSGLPWPQIFAGAMRNLLLAAAGCDFPKLRRLRSQSAEHRPSIVDAIQQCCASDVGWIIRSRFRGPWLALVDGAGNPSPLLSMPAILARHPVSGQWSRREPVQLDARFSRGGSGADLPLVLCWPAKPAAARRDALREQYPGGYLRWPGIQAFLAGGVPRDEDWYRPEELLAHRAKLGIEIDPTTRTARAGQIYSQSRLVLRPGFVRDGLSHDRVSIYGEIVVDTSHASEVRNALPVTIPFGGESRVSRFSCTTTAMLWPQADANAKQSMWLVATPGVFAAASQRPRRLGAQLQAAAHREGMAVSGWDATSNSPRPTRFATPAGAVYFVTGPGPVNGSPSLCDEPDAAEGWGFALQGVWK